ncbi:hypothetical protein CH341_07250 [Rhodoplanes roseus]|uniref:DUF2933 domain-containing protein n=1 Tax=Rhodoplanes roseus TaxID=29409 RepID=A0A327L5H7_9BRAD|nr:hypothetical protein CH341_07250 [Rhodoplanes roseus]
MFALQNQRFTKWIGVMALLGVGVVIGAGAIAFGGGQPGGPAATLLFVAPLLLCLFMHFFMHGGHHAAGSGHAHRVTPAPVRITQTPAPPTA